jgi:threonine/homoserine/homoserine lactone efflux protein
MPPVATLALFCTTALALLVVPGPAVLYIAGRSAAQGRRAGLVSVLGVHTGTTVHLLAAVAGLSAVLMASAVAFTLTRWLGAGYLIVIGVRTLARRPAHDTPSRVALAPRSLRKLYVDGVVVNVLNPKTALFFLAFLPQFVRPEGAPVWCQTLVLGLVFIALGLCSDGIYALAGARVGRWFRGRPPAPGRARRPRPQLVEGGLLVGLGVVSLAVPDSRHA